MSSLSSSHRAKKLAIHFGVGASGKVASMLERQNLTGMAASQRDLGFGAIGTLGGGALAPDGNVCFFTGVPINGPDSGQIIDAESAARLFPEWDGAFAGVFWDAQREVLVIATDCLGMQPLYLREGDGELTLVSETKALAGDPDLAAWGAFISIGHPIGERSLLRDVRRVPPGSVLTWDRACGKLDVRRYWDWPEPTDAWRNYDFLGALEQDLRGYAAYGDPGTLLLSGGFDSRLLLFLLQRAQIPADALIVAHDDEHGDADGRLAEAVARLAGIRYRKARPPADFYSSPAYLDYLRASDVGFPSLDLFIARVASQIHDAAIWDGLAPGCVFMPLHQPEGGFDAYLQQEIRGLDSASWRGAKTLFKPEVSAAMYEGFSADLRAEVARVPQDMFGLARFVIGNRSRNRPAMNPLKVYANRTLAFTPGLSRGFMHHAAMIPFAEKLHGRLYRKLFARLGGRAISVPILSGGEWMAGTGANFALSRERIRDFVDGFRTRHPSLFPRARSAPRERSRLLGPHLLDGDDDWLDPAASASLHSMNADNSPTWQLLLHWRAWQWIHHGKPGTAFGAR